MLRNERVFEAHVEVGVCVGGEGHAVLAHEVAGVAVFVLEGVFDLERFMMLATCVMLFYHAVLLKEQGSHPPLKRREAVGTDMHVHHLAIAFHAINDRRDEYKRVLARKVADAALILVTVARMGCKVEFEGRGKSGEAC